MYVLSSHAKKLLDVKQKLSLVEKSGSSSDVEELKKALTELEIEGKQLKSKETELSKKEEVHNIYNIFNITSMCTSYVNIANFTIVNVSVTLYIFQYYNNYIS